MTQENTDMVQIKYKKYSLWTIAKIIFFFMVSTYVGNLFAYGVVGTNHALAKMLHLAADYGVQLCKACLNALG